MYCRAMTGSIEAKLQLQLQLLFEDGFALLSFNSPPTHPTLHPPGQVVTLTGIEFGLSLSIRGMCSSQYIR